MGMCGWMVETKWRVPTKPHNHFLRLIIDTHYYYFYIPIRIHTYVCTMYVYVYGYNLLYFKWTMFVLRVFVNENPLQRYFAFFISFLCCKFISSISLTGTFSSWKQKPTKYDQKHAKAWNLEWKGLKASIYIAYRNVIKLAIKKSNDKKNHIVHTHVHKVSS